MTLKVKQSNSLYEYINYLLQIGVESATESYGEIDVIHILDKDLGDFEFNINEFNINTDKHLIYIGDTTANTKVNQPIGLNDYSYLFEEFSNCKLLDLSDWHLSLHEKLRGVKYII